MTRTRLLARAAIPVVAFLALCTAVLVVASMTSSRPSGPSGAAKDACALAMHRIEADTTASSKQVAVRLCQDYAGMWFDDSGTMKVPPAEFVRQATGPERLP